jgi:hypothetical protein
MPAVTTPRQRAILFALATAAVICIVMGLPQYLEGMRAVAAGSTKHVASGWLNAAALFGLPAWLWAAYSAVRRRQWSWLLVVTLLSYPGVLAYAGVGARDQSLQVAAA